MTSDDGIEKEEGLAPSPEMMLPYGTWCCSDPLAAEHRTDEYSASWGAGRPDDSLPRGDPFEIMMPQNLEFDDLSVSLELYRHEGGNSCGEDADKKGCYDTGTDGGDDDDDIPAWENTRTHSHRGHRGTASEIIKWMSRLWRDRPSGDNATLMMTLDLDDSVDMEDQPSALSPFDAGTRIFTARTIAESHIQPTQAATPPLMVRSPSKHRQKGQWPFLKPKHFIHIRREYAVTGESGKGGAGDAGHQRRHRRSLSQIIPAIVRSSPTTGGGQDHPATHRRTVSFNSSLDSPEQGRGGSYRDKPQRTRRRDLRPTFRRIMLGGNQ